jgi:F-type H+-transporting ATPase subunit gamma
VATTLPDIKRRINTTGQIRKVTATLQKVASAKLAQDLKRISNANVYFENVCRLLQVAHTAAAGAVSHPLMTTQPGDTICLMVFGSDRGLCGAFNTLLMNAIREFIKRHADKRVLLLIRGKVVFRRSVRMKFEHAEPFDDKDDIANRILSDFQSQSICEAHMLYWQYQTGAVQHIEIQQVLPTPFTSSDELSQKPISAYDSGMIEPSPEALIHALLPEYIRSSIHNGFYNSSVTENAQRRSSMSRATENATEMLGELKKTYSRLRQESITTEMLEIVAGLDR